MKKIKDQIKEIQYNDNSYDHVKIRNILINRYKIPRSWQLQILSEQRLPQR